jgi:SAM-dependent methyltransferase
VTVESSQTTRKPPGRMIRTVGRTITKAAAHAPWSWRLLRGPVRRFFDGLAPGWDERVRSGTQGRNAPLEEAVSHVEREPARVLDIGTGTGDGAFFMASRYPGAEVVGIDLAGEMIVIAQKKADGRDANVRFDVADIADYHPAERFDLVLMMNMPPFFAQVADLVRPGGYVISIASRGPTTPFYTPAKTLDRGFGKRGFRTIATDPAGTYHVAERPPV